MFPGVDKANTHRGNEIISLAESVARSMIDLDADESRRRTRDQLARVYPASFRIDSSNYSPVKMWLAGCHMGECSRDLLTVCVSPDSLTSEILAGSSDSGLHFSRAESPVTGPQRTPQPSSLQPVQPIRLRSKA